jgi:protein-tyrosine phosphatase
MQSPSTDIHPDRVVRLQGATNFRDLGGYVGHGGRSLRWRRLFRSEHLAGLTDSDHAQLQGLGVARSFDFRGQAERAATPYQVPGLTQHSLAIEPTVAQRMQDLASAGHELTTATVVGLMEDLYRSLVNQQAPRFAELFEHLLQDDAPTVFHCTAGKDRTGWAAVLILRALGVPQDVVLHDFLLTNALYQHPATPGHGIAPEVLAVLWSVRPSFLQAALQAVEVEHGGLPRYLRQRLGLTDAALAALAERYLQPLQHPQNQLTP